MKPFPCTDDFDQDIEHPDDDATNSDADDDHINLSLTFCVKTRYQRARYVIVNRPIHKFTTWTCTANV
jgi:hypothetical protein